MACPRCGSIYSNPLFSGCTRCAPAPTPLMPPRPSIFRTPQYDNVAVFEGFMLGIVAAWSAAALGLIAAVVAFFLSWGAFVVLFMFFPVPVTVLATVAWALLTGAVAGWLTENNWLWMVAAGGLAALVSVGAHMKALAVLRGDPADGS